jgi:hypothetical protein
MAASAIGDVLVRILGVWCLFCVVRCLVLKIYDSCICTVKARGILLPAHLAAQLQHAATHPVSCTGVRHCVTLVCVFCVRRLRRLHGCWGRFIQLLSLWCVLTFCPCSPSHSRPTATGFQQQMHFATCHLLACPLLLQRCWFCCPLLLFHPANGSSSTVA